MNKKIQYCIAVLLIIIIAGCNLPKYPIDDPPVVKIDTRLLGKWKLKNEKDVYVITKQNDYQYLITFKEKKKAPEKQVAFLSKVNDARFLNIYCADDSGGSYFLLRIIDVNAAANRITAATVKDSTMQYLKSSAEVRDYVVKNLDNSAFYSDTGYFYKVK